jgi:hypothetical protein
MEKKIPISGKTMLNFPIPGVWVIFPKWSKKAQ